MKTAGAVVIIVAAYIFGHMKRGTKLESERILGQMVKLMGEIKSSVEHSAASLVHTITTCAYKEAYNKLGFLAKAVVDPRTDLYLGEVLCDALQNWENASLLSRDERSLIIGVLCEIGSDCGKNETAKLGFAIERLEETLETRRESNKKHKGYYETIFTLAGIAAAILLI